MDSILKIGDATLFLGDCAALIPAIGHVDAVVMDPPYLFNADGGGKFRRQRKVMEDIDDAGINKGFDINIFNAQNYQSFVTFCHNDQLHILLPWIARNYKRHVVCAWRKTNPMPVANKHYQPETEFYIHAWNKGFHPLGELSDKKRIIDAPVGKSPYDHPTVKPDLIMDKIIKNVNAGVVLDPYMGTGSTGIAALKQGKRFIGIENNPAFFNIACQRFFEFYAKNPS